MKLSDFKLMTFDVVGTLIDFEQGILDHMRPILARAGIEVDDTAILEAYAAGEVVAQDEHPDSPFPPLLARIYRVAAARLGLAVTDVDAEGLRRSIPAWPAFPDAPAALQRLRKRYRLVAMTNSDNWALAQFARTLGEPFDDKVTAELAHASKPDPQVFAFCLGRQSVQGFDKPDILHVAQSQYHDIGVAKRLGYATCWIERRQGKVGAGGTPTVAARTEPDWHFSTLAQLADAVEAAG